jgi:hypothetical protein
MPNGVGPHATPMQTPLQTLAGRPSLPATGPVAGPATGGPPPPARTTPKAKPKSSTSSLPAPPLDDVHAAFVEFRAKEEDKVRVSGWTQLNTVLTQSSVSPCSASTANRSAQRTPADSGSISWSARHTLAL